jgi:cyclopropane-fatty-acyl-phospholipid synthase
VSESDFLDGKHMTDGLSKCLSLDERFMGTGEVGAKSQKRGSLAMMIAGWKRRLSAGTSSSRRREHQLLFLSGLLRSMIHVGHLTVIDASGRSSEFGERGTGPSVKLRMHKHTLPFRLLMNPSLAFGEAYMDGALTFEQGTLQDFLSLVSRGMAALDSHPIQRTRFHVGRLIGQRNHLRRARANVAHHYDLSGALYDLFLDVDHQYSCAYFRRGDETLEAAQEAKKKLLAAKLLLNPGCEVLDIGCGWGGLALELAQTEGAKVTGITLSSEQLATARARALAAGAVDLVRFELRDFREETGLYDRIVSVGMFEHVGQRDFATYFKSVARVLRPDGVAVIHSIGRMDPPGTSDPWIDKYIFPGGYIPALSEVMAAVEKAGLWITDIEILRVHYAETLRLWQQRFQARREEAKKIYDERFCRMWEFYLATSEMSFRNGSLMVFQLQLAHRRDAVPLTRDYISDRQWATAIPGGPAGAIMDFKDNGIGARQSASAAIEANHGP